MADRPFNLGIDPADVQARLQQLLQPGYARGGLREAIAEMEGPEAQGASSPSFEGMGEALSGIGAGISDIYSTPEADLSAYMQAPEASVRRDITPAMLGAALNPEAQGASSPSLEGVGEVLHSMGEDPAALIGGMLPGIGNALAAADVAKLKDKIEVLRAAGAVEEASKLQRFLPLAAAGVVMPFGGGAAARGAVKASEKAAVRELSPLGFYSHGAETALGLPQAKGTPEQFAAMLQKYGVKPAEMEGFGEAFAGRPSVTREEIAAHFRERMPQVEETVLGAPNKDLQKAWEKIDRLSNELYDLGITEHTPIARGTYNPDFYPAEYQGTIKELADAHKYVRDQESLGRTMAANPTKFGQYTLPGGENYREVLLKLPEKSFGRDDPRVMQEALMAYNEKDIPRLTDGQWKMLQARAARRNGEALEQPFQSSHWDDPNVLAHLRMADRTGPNGEKILHVEEIQSDWGQKGKKEGFVTKYKPEDIKEIDPANITSERRRNEFWNFETPTGAIDVPRNSRWPTMEAARQHILDNKKPTGIPTAPYVTNTQAWTDLALKRALREAAEGGYDKLVWTPGVEQAKRYDLSKQISRIGYQPETGMLYAVDTNGVRVPQLANKSYKPEELPGVIGKEAAEKLLSTEQDRLGYHLLVGNDLSMGGEGMKGYYDKIVPNQLSKLVKKLDPEAKIGRETLSTSPITPEQLMDQRTIPDRNQVDFHSLTITPKMREAILSGQTAFAEGGSVQNSGATEAADLDTLYQKYADPGYAFGGMFNDLFEGTKNIRKKWFDNPYATPAFTDSQATQDEQPATNEDKGLTQLAANYGEGAGGQAETIPSTVGSETEQPYLGGNLIMTEEENKQYDDLINSQQGEPPSFGPDNIPLPTRKPTYLQSFDYSQYANPLAARYAFLSKALNPTIAAAAMGNFQVESGNNPNQLQTSSGALTGKPLYTKEKGFENLPTGYGSAQWGTTRLTNLGANDPNKLGLYDFADRYGLDPNTTEGQDRFLVYELTTNPEYRNVYKNLLKSGNNVAGATYIFGSGYEAPKNLSASLKQRQQDALMYQNLYTNGLDKLTDAQRQRIADTQKNILDPYFNKLAEDKAALEKEQYNKWFEDQKSAFFKRTDEINAKAEADAKAKADAEAAERARVQDQVAQNNNDLGDVGFNPVVDTSVNDRIMADSNALLDQSVQSGLNYNYQDPFGLLSSGLSQYVLPETYSSSGRPGGGNDGTGTQLSISPDFPSWYTEPFAEGGSVGFKPMFDGDSEMLQARAKQLARQAYENPKSLSANERKEWNELAGKYNLPPSAGSQNTYEEQTEETMSGLQKGLSSRQKEREYAKGGLVYDPAEIDAIAAQIRGAI